MFCAPLLNLTLSFSIWEIDAITRHTTHEKSWVKWMFLNETYYSNTIVILMKHLGIESLREWQFTVWNKIRRKKKNKQNSQVLFCVSCGKVFRRRRWHPTPVLLPGKSHGQRSLVGCGPWCRKELEMTERLPFHFSLSCIGEGNGNPLQCSCPGNPRDGGTWWAAIYGVSQSRTRLKWLSSSSSGEVFGFEHL